MGLGVAACGRGREELHEGESVFHGFLAVKVDCKPQARVFQTFNIWVAVKIMIPFGVP